MNKLLAACAFTTMCCAVSVTALAGVNAPTEPSMGAPASQTGADPRTQGNDTSRGGIQAGGDSTGAGTGLGTGSMSNGTGSGNNAGGSGSSDSKSSGSSGSSGSGVGGAGG